MIIFDSSLLIDIERKYKHTIEKLQGIIAANPSALAITFPSIMEFAYGSFKSGKSLDYIKNTLSQYTLIPTTPDAGFLYGKIKLNLEKTGKLIGDFDILIAAIVILNNATLITKDKDFNRIKELRVIYFD